MDLCSSALPSKSNFSRFYSQSQFRYRLANWHASLSRHSIRILRLHRERPPGLQSKSRRWPHPNIVEAADLRRSDSKFHRLRRAWRSANVSNCFLINDQLWTVIGCCITRKKTWIYPPSLPHGDSSGKSKTFRSSKLFLFSSPSASSSSYRWRSHLVPCWLNETRAYWSDALFLVLPALRFSRRTSPRNFSWCAFKRPSFWFSVSRCSSWRCAASCFGWFCSSWRRDCAGCASVCTF